MLQKDAIFYYEKLDIYECSECFTKSMKLNLWTEKIK